MPRFNTKYTPMKKLISLLCFIITIQAFGQTDLELSRVSPAGFVELQLNSAGSLLQGFMYKANGGGAHPTLLLLHGYPGNERNLDLAQAVRAHGWNVIYFNYRGSWGSQGEFSFRRCVEDVRNIIGWCKQNAVKLEIDMKNIVLFGHSMGGFVCLEALAANPEIKKGIAVSSWDIWKTVADNTKAGKMAAMEKEADNYFVLNKPSGKALFAPVLKEPEFFDLSKLATPLANKELVMLDEHKGNDALAAIFRKQHRAYFDYQVWNTDHPFTNKRASLIKLVIAFLDRP